MLEEKNLKKIISQWLNSPEGQAQKKSFDLQKAPELLKIIKNSSAPARLMELAYDSCSEHFRKNSGMFFTPSAVAAIMVKNALDCWCRKHDSYDDLCRIKVLDPACGTGEFLLAALEELLKRRQRFKPEISTEKLTEEIILNNLYGIDSDSNVLTVMQQHFELLAGGKLEKSHFIHSNALDFTSAGACFGNNWQFDLVVGNPPYVSYGLRNTGKLERSKSEELRKRFPNSAEYKITIYAIFMEFAINSTAQDGVHSFLVPDSFLCGQYFSKIRKFILENSAIEKIILLRFKLFKAVPGSLVIYLLSKTPISKNHCLSSAAVDNFNALQKNNCGYLIRQNEFVSNHLCRFRLFFSEKIHRKVLQMEQNSVCKLGDLVTLASGIIGKYGKKSIIANTLPDERGMWKKGITSGKSIRTNEKIIWQHEYINCDPDLIKSGLGKIDYQQPKILIRQTGDRIIAAVDRDKLIVLNNVHAAVSKTDSLDLERLTAYLNSREMLLYYQAVTLENNRPMAQIDLETLRELPMKDFFRKNSK